MASKTPYTFITGNNSITIYLSGKGVTATSEHPNYEAILAAVKKGRKNAKSEAKLAKLFDTAAAVRSYVGKDINISDSGVLTHRGTVIDNVLTQKIVRMLNDGFDIKPMTNFLTNLKENPSFASQQELMTFLEHTELPLTPDGNFLAYKSVNSKYFDYHSNSFDNSIGKVVSMPRNSVDDNRNNTCSNGLHAGQLSYCWNFGSGGHLMVVKINPKDVVSIPNDYNGAKMRCCEYTVVAEVDKTETPTKNMVKAVHEY